MNALSPLGWTYGLVSRARARLYAAGLLPRHRLAGPVFAVGGLSVGGSGKTPAAALLATWLRDSGTPTAILSRGYRGSFRGRALLVADGKAVLADAASAGDEPVLLARLVPGVVVATGRRRDEVGRFVEERFGPRAHVLDDGFQHLRLERDLDVLCLSPGDLGDRPLPAGRLREPLSAAARADAILLDESDASASAVDLLELCLDRCHRVVRRPGGCADLSGAAVPPPARPWLVAGIARPERFRADVERLGLDVKGARFFADHHRFRVEELRGVAEAAAGLGADALLITAKDAVRWPAVDLPLPVRVLGLSLEVESAEELRHQVLARAKGRT
jgi:tetraacyldisaccharide 4'-kinase